MECSQRDAMIYPTPYILFAWPALMFPISPEPGKTAWR
jgi:hypothetical protein